MTLRQYLLLMGIGVATILSATYSGRQTGLEVKQVYWILIGLVALLVCVSIDYRRLVVNEEAGTAFLMQKGMRANLGGIGKGYAVERGASILRGRGIGAIRRTDESGMLLPFFRMLFIFEIPGRPDDMSAIMSSKGRSTRCSAPLIAPTRGLEPFFFAT